MRAKSLSIPGFHSKHCASGAEDLLALQLKAVPEHPLFERQMRIHPQRKFMADFFFPASRHALALVVEVDGGIWVGGRHTTGRGVESDCEKSFLIAQMPARLMRVTPNLVRNGKALKWILEALER